MLFYKGGFAVPKLGNVRLLSQPDLQSKLAPYAQTLNHAEAAGCPSPNEDWLDLDSAAVVEVTSEEKEYPVESALVSGETQGWRAADSGTQTIRLVFDVPQWITRVWLVFEETEAERTQEFRVALVFRWRTLVSRNCAPAVELQPSSDNTRDRGLSGRTIGCHRSRIGHCAGQKSRSRSRLAHEFALGLTVIPVYWNSL